MKLVFFDSEFGRVFWPSFWATVAGVILSVGLMLAVWFGQQWYVDRGNRNWVKESLTSELSVNILKLRQLQDVVRETREKGVVLAQFFPFYLDTSVYSASVNSGNLKLLNLPLQGGIHGAYSNFEKFNILLSNVESFAIYNLSTPSFKQELSLRCEALSKQAGEFAVKAEKTLKELGGTLISGTDIPNYQITATEIAPAPASAKYAILQLINEGDKPQEVSLRTKEGDPPQVYHLEPKSEVWAVIGLSGGRFQANVSSTDCRILFRGYIEQ